MRVTVVYSMIFNILSSEAKVALFIELWMTKLYVTMPVEGLPYNI